MTIYKDDRVYYISGAYSDSLSNPLKGGDYSCKGTVRYISSHGIMVDWDNGKRNTYNSSDLEHVNDLKPADPNKLFKRLGFV